MKQNNLPKISTRKGKRLGRGIASGKGKTAGRGTKGQKSRAGYNLPRRFEGGQMPWIQRLPKKRGFRSRNLKPQVIKLSVIERKFKPGDKVEPKTLLERGLVKTLDLPIKILADRTPEKTFRFRGVALSEKILGRMRTRLSPTKKRAPKGAQGTFQRNTK